MLPLHRHHLTFRVKSTLKLPYFEGSSLRGILGQLLIKHNEPVYQYLFEGLFTDGRKQPGNYVVNPMVIEPHQSSKIIYHAGETFCFDLVLVGEAQKQFQAMVQALQNLHKMPLGAMRGRLRLEEIERIENVIPATQAIETEPESEEQSLELRFTTPFFLKNLEKNSDYTFENCINRLYMRYKQLARYYCNLPLPGAETEKDYLQQAEQVAIKRINITPHFISHWSNRSKEYKQLKCQIGTLKYTGNIAPFLPLLQLGTHIHIGTGATSGLGKYEIGFKA